MECKTFSQYSKHFIRDLGSIRGNATWKTRGNRNRLCPMYLLVTGPGDQHIVQNLFLKQSS